MCVCVRERVCVCEREGECERDRASVCVCQREGKREREESGIGGLGWADTLVVVSTRLHFAGKEQAAFLEWG